MESVQQTIRKRMMESNEQPIPGDATVKSPFPEISEEISVGGDTFVPLSRETIVRAALSLSEGNGRHDGSKSVRNDRMLTFDLHPMYSSILQDGAFIREGDVLGLDGDLRRVLVAPFDGSIRLLVTGTGPDRRVRVYLSEHKDRRESFAAGRR